jgi:hypothetical protein
MDDLRNARAALEALARDYDPALYSGDDAIACMKELGTIRRLTDGMIAKTAKRLEDTAAHTYGTDRSAAELTSRLVGVTSGEAKQAIDVASKLEALPAVDAAVRAGRVSTRQADLIAATASEDPSLQRDLLSVASQGMVALRDACVAARAAREDQAARSARQDSLQSYRSWTNLDGMLEFHGVVIPEAGGPIAAKIENGTRRKFRDARRDGARRSQDYYAAQAFIEAILGEPAAAGAEPSGDEPLEATPKPKTQPRLTFTTHVVLDHEVLTRGNALPGETCEIPGVGPVNAQWVREILGSAFITAIVKKGKDITTVAHLGRHVPAEVQTALIVSGRECSIEGCSGREYLERDHCEIDFAADGPTAFWNLIWLCSIHHSRKSSGWTLGPPDPVTGKRRLDPPRAKARVAGPPGTPTRRIVGRFVDPLVEPSSKAHITPVS